MKVSELKQLICETLLDNKQLVKSMLVEILQEGLGSSVDTEVVETRQHVQPRPRLPVANAHLDEIVRSTAKIAAGKDTGSASVMQAILADTARTTLQEQMKAGDAGHDAGPSMQQKELFDATPEQAFGDASSRWAACAFANQP